MGSRVEKHLSRLAMPKTWKVKRKGIKWVTRPLPGAHSLKQGMPISVLLRDVLKLARTTKEVKKLFKFLNLEMDQQTKNFLTYCHKSNSNDPYSVYKSKKVKDRWKDELNLQIQNKIITETKREFPTLLKEFK